MASSDWMGYGVRNPSNSYQAYNKMLDPIFTQNGWNNFKSNIERQINAHPDDAQMIVGMLNQKRIARIQFFLENHELFSDALFEALREVVELPQQNKSRIKIIDILSGFASTAKNLTETRLSSRALRLFCQAEDCHAA